MSILSSIYDPMGGFCLHLLSDLNFCSKNSSEIIWVRIRLLPEELSVKLFKLPVPRRVLPSEVLSVQSYQL